MTRYTDADGNPATPDTPCRWCKGKGTIMEYAGYGYRTIAMPCVDCDGTGWQGLRFAPVARISGHDAADKLMDAMPDERRYGTWRE